MYTKPPLPPVRTVISIEFFSHAIHYLHRATGYEGNYFANVVTQPSFNVQVLLSAYVDIYFKSAYGPTNSTDLPAHELTFNRETYFIQQCHEYMELVYVPYVPDVELTAIHLMLSILVRNLYTLFHTVPFFRDIHKLNDYCVTYEKYDFTTNHIYLGIRFN